MAVAFDAVGPSSSGASTATAGPLSWTHTGSGSALLAGVSVDAGSDAGFVCSCTCDGAAMTSLGKVESGTGGAGFLQVFAAAGLSGSSHALVATVTSGTPGDMEGGSLSFTGAGATVGAAFGTPATVSVPNASTDAVTVTPTASGNMVAAFLANGDTISSVSGPATSRFIVNLMGGGGSGTGNAAGATSPSTGSAVTTTWTAVSTFGALLAVEVRAPSGIQPPGALLPLLAPGWFPGSAAVIQDPGGIPFYAEPAPTDAAPAVILPPTPEADPVTPLAPGWFPGADRVTAGPGAVPFAPQPPPLTGTQPLIFPVPEVAGEVQWLPWPPNYFPGSQAVSVDPGGIPFYSQPQPLTPPPAPAAPPVITSSALASGGTKAWFTDQNGNPVPFLGEDAWALAINAGRWNGGNYRSDIDSYLSTRAAQGYNAVEISAFSVPSIPGLVFTDSRDYNGAYPFTSTNNPSSGLNDAFWARRDYLVSSAAAYGIAVVISLSGPLGSGGIVTSWTGTQFTDYGTAIGNRYKGYGNILWIVGDDYFGGQDSGFASMLTAMRAAGDSRLISIQNQQETTSRYAFGPTHAADPNVFGKNAQYDWIYTYNVSYNGVTYAATLEPSASDVVQAQIPVVWGDGHYLDGSTAQEQIERNMLWWALTSGAAGVTTGDNNVFAWGSGSAAAMTATSFYTIQMPAITSVFRNLPGWWKLLPDSTSALVTAGRGTPAADIATGDSAHYYQADTDRYVTAAYAADGTLALVYCAGAFSITIDQTKMAAGYTATWVDPASGAATGTTAGSTYNSTPRGNNSAGNADWLLVLQGTPATAPPSQGLPEYQPQPPGWFPGADRVTNLPGGIPFYVVPQATDQNAAQASVTTTATAALAGASAVAALVTEAPIATAAGAGAVAAVVTQDVSAAPAAAGTVAAVVTEIAGASLAGAGAVTASGSGGTTATLAGAGSVAAVVTQAVIASPAGAGSVAAVVTQTATASLAGAGAVTANVTQAVTASPAGAGALTANVTQAVTATAAGAGSVTDVVTQAVIASMAGAGVLTANPAGAGSTANLAGAGAVTALATVAATATAAGAGAVAAVVTERVPAALSGAGVLTAAGQITGTANLTAAGALSAKAVQAVTAQAAGAGALTAAATQAAAASLAAAGTVTAVSGTQVAFTVGQLSATTAAGSTLTATTAPLSVLTATDQRTGGSGG